MCACVCFCYYLLSASSLFVVSQRRINLNCVEKNERDREREKLLMITMKDLFRATHAVDSRWDGLMIALFCNDTSNLFVSI